MLHTFREVPSTAALLVIKGMNPSDDSFIDSIALMPHKDGGRFSPRTRNPLLSSLPTRPLRTGPRLAKFAVIVICAIIIAVQFATEQRLNLNNSLLLDETSPVARSDEPVTPPHDNAPRVVQLPAKQPLPYNPFTSNPRNMTGAWIANTWIPPIGWRYFMPWQLRELYQDRNMLWIGDSIGRRTSMTLFALVNATEPHISADAVSSFRVIDVAKENDQFSCTKWMDSPHRPKICRALPGTGELLYVKENCNIGVERFFKDELEGKSNIAQNSQLVVLAGGIWEVDIPDKCFDFKLKRTINEVNADLLRILDQYQQQTGKFILIRTSGFSDWGPARMKQVQKMNDFLMDEIDKYTADYAARGLISNLTYINWGGAVEPRSLDEDRIYGDNKAHYGIEPRLVMIQQMTNFLQDRGFFDLQHS
jgi:hypothetical protein